MGLMTVMIKITPKYLKYRVTLNSCSLAMKSIGMISTNTVPKISKPESPPKMKSVDWRKEFVAK